MTWLAVTRIVAMAVLVGLTGLTLSVIAGSALLHHLFLAYVFPLIISLLHLSGVCA